MDKEPIRQQNGCGFNRRIDAIEAMMLKQPPFFPTGYTFQGYNNCNPCCNGSF